MDQKPKLLPTASLIIIFALIFILIGGVSGYLIKSGMADKEIKALETEEILGGQADEPKDLFGKQVGTSTTPTSNLGTPGYPTSPNSDFSDTALQPYVTTSKSIILDGETDIALFTFDVLNASSSNYFSYDILGSNDTNCTTTATSTTDDNYNPVVALTSDIHWFDIGTDGARVSGSKEDIAANVTSTSRVLTNLNWKCLRLDLRGASTTVWAQIRQKTLK